MEHGALVAEGGGGRLQAAGSKRIADSLVESQLPRLLHDLVLFRPVACDWVCVFRCHEQLLSRHVCRGPRMCCSATRVSLQLLIPNCGFLGESTSSDQPTSW